MADNYLVKDIVWIKVKHFPWWPGTIAKIAENANGSRKYAVNLIGEKSHAIVSNKHLASYNGKYKEYSEASDEALKKAIIEANEIKLYRLFGGIDNDSGALLSKDPNLDLKKESEALEDKKELEDHIKEELISSIDKELPNSLITSIEEAKGEKKQSVSAINKGNENIKLINKNNEAPIISPTIDYDHLSSLQPDEQKDRKEIEKEEEKSGSSNSETKPEIKTKHRLMRSARLPRCKRKPVAINAESIAHITKEVHRKGDGSPLKIKKRLIKGAMSEKITQNPRINTLKSVKQNKKKTKEEKIGVLTLEELKEKIKEFDSKDEYVLAYVPVKVLKTEVEKFTIKT